MNNLDKTYTSLLQDILDNGIEKKDRTGTGTLSVFGRQIRHKMSEGFPLLTTKKMAFKTMVTELLWFLRGDTNIKFLVDNNCHIWDGDAYKNYCKYTSSNSSEWNEWMRDNGNGTLSMYTQEQFINKIKTDDGFAKKWGELGPIYGKQWRNWNTLKWEATDKIDPLHPDRPMLKWNLGGIDQIANLINDLKTNPDSRRLMVSAWNVGELDQMVLPPCHYGFQVYTRELSEEERRELYNKNYESLDKEGLDQLSAMFETDNITPTRAISLMWNQRSVDTFLGLPFNIASYGLLLEIIAKEVNMVPDELIGNLGDTHLYSNHIEQAREQIGRELTIEERVKLYEVKTNTDTSSFPILHETLDFHNIPKRTREQYSLPALNIKLHFNNEPSFVPEYWLVDDFEIVNYQSHTSIKAPLSN